MPLMKTPVSVRRAIPPEGIDWQDFFQFRNRMTRRPVIVQFTEVKPEKATKDAAQK